MTLSGSATYSDAAGVATRGFAAGRSITYLDNGVTVRGAGVDTNFSLTQGNLSLTRIAARLLGGGVTGDAEIRNLFSDTTNVAAARIAQATQTGKSSAKQKSNAPKSSLPT